MKIYFIEWLDACHSSGSWVSKEEIEKESLCKVQSVGFLISENKERIIISSSWDGYYASGEITIPKKMIIKKIDMPIIVPKIE